jgi:predicted lipoprotein with Yx(FWY)xxD motif
MHLSSRWASLAGLAVGVAIIATACTSAASTPGAAGAPGASNASSASNAPAGATTMTIATTTDSTLGAFLTGPNGMTLYVLTTDTPNTSSCAGSCATNWPPLTVASGATVMGPSSATGTFGTSTRADGTVQVTYNKMPLYYFAGDSASGDTNGQGKNGTWFVAPLSGSLAPAASPASSKSASSGY